jgi:hypothetical protein
MDESYGDITKIIKLNNNDVICLQQDGVSNLNRGKNIIEQTDGTQLVVNSSTIINNPRYISISFGTNDIRSVVTNGNTIYFVDTKRRKIYALGASGSVISDIGMASYFYSELELGIYNNDNSFMAGYDYNRSNLWVSNRPFTSTLYATSNDRLTSTATNTAKANTTWVYNDMTKSFVSQIVQNEGYILNAFHAHNKFYLIGVNNEGLQLAEMYEGAYGKILARQDISADTLDSEFTMIINPQVLDEKIFD